MASMADIIAIYLQEQLQDSSNYIEVSRKELADYFDCVPSQITYVLQTRFTPRNGYRVVSVRGGGGYIRIFKRVVDHKSLPIIEDAISEKSAQLLIDSLYNQRYIDTEQHLILRTTTSNHTFGFSGTEADKLRSRLLRSLFNIMLVK
jgi:transcriptional regulator of stress and heat shock response